MLTIKSSRSLRAGCFRRYVYGMNKIAGVALFSILIYGCSSLPIIEHLDQLEGCKKLSVVEGKGEFERDAAIALVRESKKLGGNVVYLPAKRFVEVTIAHAPGSGPGREAWQEINLVGTAYLCP
jgi:hypothetical protein